MTLHKDLLEILACPDCKGNLTLLKEEGLLCEKCNLVYPIKEGIPVMIKDQAVPKAKWNDSKL